MSLSRNLIDWLNGGSGAFGHPVTDDAFRTELQLGDLLNIVATLEGTAEGEGTDLIGVPDGSSYFAGAVLSDVLDELFEASADGYFAFGNGLAAAKVETRLVADLTELRTQLTALRVDTAEVRQKLINTLGKLDLDGGVTDTNYAATNSPAALTSAAPAALTTAVLGTTVLAQGGTAGRIRLNADIEFNIGGARYRKAPTDDLWNLSALGTTSASEYKAVRLYLSTAGAASVAAGTAAASATAAKAALPALDTTKAHIGTYVMGLSGNFANALDAQGTYQDGWPVAVAS